MLSRFRWITFDVSDLLPPCWQEDVHELAVDADFHEFPRTPVVSREVLSNDPTARGLAEIERDCTVIRPHAGHLVFFDARDHPHYARPLKSDSDVRILADMNFYTESCPESTRPKELNRHLYGDQ